VSGAPGAEPKTWGRWFGRPGRSLTRRLIWLASAWIVLALMIAGWVLTSQYQESALRRLGNVLGETIDEVVLATQAAPEGLLVAEIKDSQSLRPLSGKYWAVAELDEAGDLRVLARSPSLAGEDLSAPPELADRLRRAFGQTISYNADGPIGRPLRVAASL
jgi:hypothetical protein